MKLDFSSRKSAVSYLLLLSLFVGSGAFAQSTKLSKADKKHLTVASVDVIEEEVFDLAGDRVCDDQVKPADNLHGIDWNLVVNIGKQIWTIVEKNAPKVTTEIQQANAVPAGLTNWYDLECWQTPQVKAYRATYKNLYGVKVVDFAYQVIYTYGGRVSGKGRYLSQVSIVPTDLSVAWGYTFDAKVKIENVTNAGTQDSPMGAIQLSLNWGVKTVLKYNEVRENYYVRGDGHFQRL
jgi:hypothetical protein